MARKGRKIKKRTVAADPVFGDKRVTRMVNLLMICGKKTRAEAVTYGCLEILKERAKKEDALKGDALVLFEQALENVKPVIEVKSRRVGGSTYQVPVEVRPDRRESLGLRWIVQAAAARKEHSMAEKLAAEFVDAYYRRGTAVKKREDVHRMAEANKAFAHYRW